MLSPSRRVSQKPSGAGTVRLEVRVWNIAVAALSLLLLVMLVGYFFTENIVYRP